MDKSFGDICVYHFKLLCAVANTGYTDTINLESSKDRIFLLLGLELNISPSTEFETDDGKFTMYLANVKDNFGFIQSLISDLIEVRVTADGSRYEFPNIRHYKPIVPLPLNSNFLSLYCKFLKTANVYVFGKCFLTQVDVSKATYYKTRVFDNP